MDNIDTNLQNNLINKISRDSFVELLLIWIYSFEIWLYEVEFSFFTISASLKLSRTDALSGTNSGYEAANSI